jgi:hypothetical protein
LAGRLPDFQTLKLIARSERSLSCTVAAKRPELNGDFFLIIPAATVSVDVKRARSFCFRLYQKRGNETTFMDLQHRRKLRALRIP